MATCPDPLPSSNPCLTLKGEIDLLQSQSAIFKDQIAVLDERDCILEEQLKKIEDDHVADVHVVFCSDTGTPGASQDSLVDAITLKNPDLVLQTGNQTYSGTGTAIIIAGDNAAFNSWINTETLLPALGDRDLDVDPVSLYHGGVYPYLPNNKRYYSKYYEEYDLEIFTLNSGVNSADALVEPDGNTIGSAQHTWFLAALNSSVAKWKVVQFSRPIMTQLDGAVAVTDYLPDMDWLFYTLDVDLIINGESLQNTHHELLGKNYVQVSGAVRPIRETRIGSDEPYGDPSTVLYYKDIRAEDDKGKPAFGQFKILGDIMQVEFVDVTTGLAFYSFQITK